MTRVNDPAAEVQTSSSFHFGWKVMLFTVSLRRDNGNVHRAAANIIVSKSRAARGSVCNVLLSRDCTTLDNSWLLCVPKTVSIRGEIRKHFVSTNFAAFLVLLEIKPMIGQWLGGTKPKS